MIRKLKGFLCQMLGHRESYRGHGHWECWCGGNKHDIPKQGVSVELLGSPSQRGTIHERT